MSVIPFNTKGDTPKTPNFQTMYTVYYKNHFNEPSTAIYTGVGFVAGDCFVIQDPDNWAPLFIIPTNRMFYATTEQVEVIHEVEPVVQEDSEEPDGTA